MPVVVDGAVNYYLFLYTLLLKLNTPGLYTLFQQFGIIVININEWMITCQTRLNYLLLNNEYDGEALSEDRILEKAQLETARLHHNPRVACCGFWVGTYNPRVVSRYL